MWLQVARTGYGLGGPVTPYVSGNLAEQRWDQVAFKLPESSLDGCWWLPPTATKAPARGRAAPRKPKEERPRFLWQSMAVLVADLHQTRFATVRKLSDELHGRLERNRELMREISNTRLWRRHGPERWVQEFLAVAAGRAGTGNKEPPAAELEELARHWHEPPPEAPGPDDTAQWSAVVPSACGVIASAPSARSPRAAAGAA